MPTFVLAGSDIENLEYGVVIGPTHAIETYKLNFNDRDSLCAFQTFWSKVQKTCGCDIWVTDTKIGALILSRLKAESTRVLDITSLMVMFNIVSNAFRSGCILGNLEAAVRCLYKIAYALDVHNESQLMAELRNQALLGEGTKTSFVST